MIRTIIISSLAMTIFSVIDVQADEVSLSELRARAGQFLKLTQNSDGSWTKNEFVGVTGLVTASLLRSGWSPDDPVVASGLKNLSSQEKPDGGFYAEDSLHKNYETCITIMALSEANADGRYDTQIETAEGFLRGLQWDKGEGVESSDPAWGGGGYGKHERPDMSNTQYLIEALKKAGVTKDDEAMKNVLVFVSRSQNLESIFNDTKFAGLINDGGFYYTPAAGGDSKAGVNDNGGLQKLRQYDVRRSEKPDLRGPRTRRRTSDRCNRLDPSQLHLGGESGNGTAGTVLLFPHVR